MKFLKIHKQISIDAAVSRFLEYAKCRVTDGAYRKPGNKGDQLFAETEAHHGVWL